MIDTGIMNGPDIVASMALGADFTLIGRAYLYGLMAGGRQGVDRTIDILSTEIRAHHAPAGGGVPRRARAPAHVTQLHAPVSLCAKCGRRGATPRRASVHCTEQMTCIRKQVDHPITRGYFAG